MPTIEDYIKQLQIVPGTNVVSNHLVRQAVQQPRQRLKIKQENPKTRAEGSYRNIERRRSSGKSADQESRERDIRPQLTWRSDVADALHTVGNLSTGAAAIGSLVMAPIPTALAIAGGATGGAAVDKAVDRFTDSSSWAQWFNHKLRLRDNSMIGELTNPGMIIGGTIGAKASPAVSRGFQYAWETIPRGKPAPKIDLSNNIDLSHITLESPLMTSISDLRAAITPKDLANRKFFSVEEYGSEPIYTRETAPTRIKVKEGDITESHINDGTPGSEVRDANKVANEWFTKANHGQSASYETDYSLSTDSYPIALLKMNRWQQQGLGQFVQSESAPQWMRLNRLGNKSFEELQEAINRVNKLTGQNYKIEQRLSPVIGANGQPTLHPITGKPLMAKGIYVQPIGFFKYKKGNKIRAKLVKH